MDDIIETLAIILSMILFVQVIALFMQYKVNKGYRGIHWLVLGSAVLAVGFILTYLYFIPDFALAARISNPLIVLGLVFLHFGFLQFLKQKVNMIPFAVGYSIFLVAYYFFMFGMNSLAGRSVAVSFAEALLLIATAYRLFANKDRHIGISRIFTAIPFLLFGLFSIVRVYFSLRLSPENSYTEQTIILVLSFVVPLVTSTLWTFGFIIMLNQRLYAENHEEKDKLQKVLNTSPDASIITTKTEGIIVDVNEAFIRMTGYTKENVIGNSILRTKIWEKAEDRQTFIQELESKGRRENKEMVLYRKDGAQLIGMISSGIIQIHEQSHIVSFIQDITEHRKIEEAIRESEEIYRSVLNASPDNITITDLKGQIMLISPMASRMFGYEPDFSGFVGMKIMDFIVPEEVERAHENILKMFNGNYSGPNEYHGVKRDRSIFHIETNSALIRGADGNPSKMIFVIRDITERKQAELQIQSLIRQLEIERNIAQINSITDSLTGISNRRYVDEALSKEFFRLKRTGSDLTLIMLDVDYFKKYNDLHGHIAGDECLRQIGAVLQVLVGRGSDIVARYGGEEFIIVLPDTLNQGAAVLAERIRKEVEALEILHGESDISPYVTVSLGVVTVKTMNLKSADEAVKLADEAMYCAKRAGRNRISISVAKDA